MQTREGLGREAKFGTLTGDVVHRRGVAVLDRREQVLVPPRGEQARLSGWGRGLGVRTVVAAVVAETLLLVGLRDSAGWARWSSRQYRPVPGRPTVRVRRPEEWTE